MNILKEIYFLILLIIYEYLEKIDDILFLDESNDNKRLFLIFKDNLIELSSLIYVCTLNKNKNKENDIIINYLDNKNLIKWIIKLNLGYILFIIIILFIMILNLQIF